VLQLKNKKKDDWQDQVNNKKKRSRKENSPDHANNINIKREAGKALLK